MSCPACNKMSGHPEQFCPEAPISIRFVEIPKEEADILNARLKAIDEALERAGKSRKKTGGIKLRSKKT